jgi:RalBP1-associated Eps domain-containing protein
LISFQLILINFHTQKQPAGDQFVTTIRLDNPPIPQPRLTLTNTQIGPAPNGGAQRTSAFEVYRKPSRSPPSTSAQNEAKIQEYEKQVLAISENLKQVKFPRSSGVDQSSSSQDLLKYLKEQNSLLIRLCNDLSDELMGVQKKKEEIRGKVTDK